MREMDFSKCKTLSDMLNELRSVYDVRMPLGSLTKPLIIVMLNSKLPRRLTKDETEKLNSCRTVGDLVGEVIANHGSAEITEKNRTAISAGLKSLVKMTRLQPR